LVEAKATWQRRISFENKQFDILYCPLAKH
jgi:hypothetical protein